VYVNFDIINECYMKIENKYFIVYYYIIMKIMRREIIESFKNTSLPYFLV